MPGRAATLDSFHAKIKYILFLSWLPCIENFQNCDSKETVYAGLTLIFEAASYVSIMYWLVF